MFGTFELRRGDVPQRRVSTLSVVKHFDVLGVPDRIVIAIVAEFKVHRFWCVERRFPELLRILEKRGDAA